MAECPENCTTEVCTWTISNRLEGTNLFLDVTYDGQTYAGQPIDLKPVIQQCLQQIPECPVHAQTPITYSAGPGSSNTASSFVLKASPTIYCVTDGPSSGTELWVVREDGMGGWQWHQLDQ